MGITNRDKTCNYTPVAGGYNLPEANGSAISDVRCNPTVLPWQVHGVRLTGLKYNFLQELQH